VARITIPQRNRAGLSKYLALPPEAFDGLLASLASQPPKLDLPIRAPDKITLPGVSRSELDDILSSIVSLSVVRWSRDVSIEDFVSDVAEAISAFDPAGQSDDAKQRLSKVLGIDSLLISSKALTIFTDYQRTIHASKILSDLRYVFKMNPDEEPYGAVIVHLLKLSYHEDTEHKEFFVAMDDNDLKDLKEVIARAEKKAHTLRRKLEAGATPYLGAEGKIR
jgi:hypothetical protein